MFDSHPCGLQPYLWGPGAGALATEPMPGTSTQTPGFSCPTAPRDAFPAPPFRTSTPLSQGGAGHGNAHPHDPLALSLAVPPPLHPVLGSLIYLSSYLTIYLFIYLRFKLFIVIY